MRERVREFIHDDNTASTYGGAGIHYQHVGLDNAFILDAEEYQAAVDP